MSAAVLFPADPLAPRRVDPHFAAQAAAVRQLDGRVALIDHDALLAGDLATATGRLPADLGPAWYRGWMVPVEHYAGLAAAVDLLTTPEAYRAAHELPGWYAAFADVTPASVWSDRVGVDLPSLVAPLGPGPAVVKDYVKSRKHEWDSACFIPALSDAAATQAVVRTFVERQDDHLAGGIVIRAFEELDPGEARVWWIDGSPVLVGPHPDTPGVLPEPDLSIVPRAALQRFVTTDLARHADGRWRVVEVGDGQVSDLPAGIDPVRLMEPLLAAGGRA